MNKFYYISLIFYLGSILSCEMALDPSAFETEKKMVLNCLFSPNERWNLELSTSENILDPNDQIQFIDDAKILLFNADNSLIGEFKSLGEGRYEIRDLYPIAAKSYSIRVEHADYPMLSAQSSVPVSVVTDEPVWIKVFDDGQEWLNIETSIKDPVVEGAQMVLSNLVVKRYEDTPGDTLEIKSEAWLETLDGEEYCEKLLDGNAVNTKLFYRSIPEDRILRFLSYDGFKRADEPSLVEGKFEISFQTASREYYKYIKSMELYKMNNNFTSSSIIAPVHIYCNVNGGLGVFAGFSSITYINSF